VDEKVVKNGVYDGGVRSMELGFGGVWGVFGLVKNQRFDECVRVYEEWAFFAPYRRA
jgi:hypothetical protein